MFPYFEIFGVRVAMYGVCSVFGLLACGFCGIILAKRYSVTFERVILLMLACGAGMVVGGHLLFAITQYEDLFTALSLIGKADFNEIVNTIIYCFSGMVFYGGFLGGLLAVAIYSHFDKTMKPINMINIYAVCTPLFHIFGRLGCFCSGCCYGFESSFGFTAHNNPYVSAVNDVSRFPVPLVEAFCNLLIFLLLLWLWKRKTCENRLIFVYMLVYPVVRFSLEFLRGDLIRGIWFGLSTSQWISIVLFIIAIVGLIKTREKSRS